ncbi:unnamed protein product [Danaus chrysippus]|uniref:(African queen) hypothetical protein n=1 Tax=Danaus chrysippus TaxID=151541 RepID=A0A8J2QXM9_9NEOP|nr:unnamed protein product [Danaus chrysippus]
MFSSWKGIVFFITTCSAIVAGQNVSGPKHGKNIVCFLASWSFYRLDPIKFHSSDLDLSLCTHIVYSFAVLDENTNEIKSSDAGLDIENKDETVGYKAFVDLKKQNPHLKVTLCVGGWNEGSRKYSKMARGPNSRKQFIQSVITYLQTYNFDGLDIMWKYPTTRGGEKQDRENFVTLIKELKEAFLPHNLILTASLTGVKDVMEPAYDLGQLNKYLDMIHVLGYDYHGPWDGIVGANSPLSSTSQDNTRNLEYTIRYMIALGVNPEKIALGLPLFGRTFLLNNPKEERVQFGGTTVKGVGFPGPIIKGINYYAYNEVCMELTNKSVPWDYHWDEESSTPYLRDKDRIISYDNPRSIANKVKLAIDYNLGGFMVWSVDTDDFKGLCDPSNDTYVDYEARINRISEDQTLQDAIHRLDLSEMDYYVKMDNKLKFNKPKQEFKNFQMMRTIDQATSVALEEIKIVLAIWEKRRFVNEISGTSFILPTNDDCEHSCVSSCIKMCQNPFL